MVSCLSRLHIRSSSQQLRQWVQQKRAHIRKTSLMKELGKYLTAAQAVQLDSVGIGIQDLVQLRDCNSQEDFLTALREGVRIRDYSHTLRKPPLAGVGSSCSSKTISHTNYTQFPLPSQNNRTITSTLLLHEHTTERFTNNCFISWLKKSLVISVQKVGI